VLCFLHIIATVTMSHFRYSYRSKEGGSYASAGSHNRQRRTAYSPAFNEPQQIDAFSSNRNSDDETRSCYNDEDEGLESQRITDNVYNDEGLEFKKMNAQLEESSNASFDPEKGLPFHKKRKGKLMITTVSIIIFVLIALILTISTTKSKRNRQERRPQGNGGNNVLVPGSSPTFSPTKFFRSRSPTELSQPTNTPTIKFTPISVPPTEENLSSFTEAPISSFTLLPLTLTSSIPSAPPSKLTVLPTFTPIIGTRKDKYNKLVKALAFEGITPANSLLTVGGRKTPQIRAINWLLDDDPQDLLGATASTMSTRIFQRYILATFFYSMKGERWKIYNGWLNSSHECGWFGLSCENKNITSIPLLRIDQENREDGAVTQEQIVVSLDLEGNNMQGTLPFEIGYLTDCTVLSLYGNSLSGTLPATLGQMAELKKLWLDENEFTGFIPSELGLLRNVDDISIYENQLVGTLPTELGLLSRMERFWANDMQISGNIPTEFGKLTNLVNFYLDVNSITGIIPSELGLMTNLKDIRLFRNRMGGHLPIELFGLSNLEIAYLDTNRFLGEIPREITGLISIRDLQLFSNRLSGTLPIGLGSLEDLQVLRLNGNDFTGTIPAQLGSNQKLLRITLSSNRLVGTIPDPLQQSSLLKRIEVDLNNLDGSLPTWIGTNLDQLLTLNVASNRLKGSIPTSFGNLKNLEEVRLEDNDIIGIVPKEWCGLETLSSLSSDCGGVSPQIECSCCTYCSEVQAVTRTTGAHH